MTTESIQTDPRLERRARWQHIADSFGLPLTGGELVRLDSMTDLDASRVFFGHLSDEERHELLWAAAVAPEFEDCCC